MLMLMITITLIFLGIVFKNDNKIYAIQTGYLFFLWGFAEKRVDLIWYEYDFNHAKNGWSLLECFTSEKIQEYSYWIVKSLGGTFEIFLIINALICVGLLASSINYFAKENKCLVLSLMLIYPIIEYSIEIQGRTAFCLILYALRYLEKISFKNIIKYIIAVFIATGIHTAAIETLIFILVPLVQNRKVLTKISIWGFILELVFLSQLFVLTNLLNLGGIRIAYFDEENANSLIKFIALILWQIILVALSFKNDYFKIILAKYDNEENENLMIWIEMLLLLCYPPCLISQIFFRIPRYLILIAYCSFAKRIKSEKNNRNLLTIMMVLFACFSVYWLNAQSWSSFENWYIYNVLTSNRLIREPKELLGGLALILVFVVVFYLVNNTKIVFKKGTGMNFVNCGLEINSKRKKR